MGTTEYGSPQLLTFDYNQDATGKLFNGINFKLTPSGIYEGFTLTRISNAYVTVSTGTCFIQDSSAKTGTRISTGSEQQVQVTSATPYIVLRFDWVDSPNNYMDILAVAYADINSDDLIVGRCIYDDAGTTLSSSFDYTRRSNQFLQKQKTESTYLKVTPTEPYSKKFVVSSGVLNSSKGNLLISGGTFPTSDLPNTINGRNDLVWIDENGAVHVLQGTDSSSPVTPRYGNRKVVAEIRRGAARTSIRGNEIVQVITSFDSAPITSDLLITDSGNLYGSTNVEDAFQEIAGSNFTFKGEKTFNNGLLAKASQTITGAVGNDIQTLKKNDGTTIQRNDLNGKLINTVGSEIAFLDTYSKYTTDKLDSAINQIAGEAMSIGGVKTFASSPVIPTATMSTQAANFGQVVRLSGDQTIGGVKTFTSSPVIPTATSDAQAVNFGQVVRLSSDQTIGGVKTFTSSPIVPTATMSTQAVNFGQVVRLSSDQTIGGVKTFTASPVVPDATSGNQVPRFGQVVKLNGNEAINGVKTFASSPVIPTATSDAQAINFGQVVRLSGDQTVNGLKTFDNGISVKESQTVTGAPNSDIQTLKKNDGTTIQRNDLNGKFINTVGSEIAFLDTYSKYTTDKLDSAINQIAGEAMSIGGVKTFSSSPIVPTAYSASQAVNFGQVVRVADNQTVNGIKTFTSSPVIPVATSDDQAANFGQVVRLSSNQTIGGVKTFASSPSVPTATSENHVPRFGQVVKLNGNEAINGVKTFNNGIISNVTGNLNGNADYATNATNATFAGVVGGMQRKWIAIGSWNMFTTGQVEIPHGITGDTPEEKLRKITNVSVIIIDDIRTVSLKVETSGMFSINGTNIVITRPVGGVFDNDSYESTTKNRGYIVIDYISKPPM